MTREFKRFRLFFPSIALVGILSVLILVCGCKPEASRYDDGAIGQDPHNTFPSAALMYQVSETKPFDRTARRLISRIDLELKRNRLPEEKSFWNSLTALNPYRQTDQVQAELSKWVVRVSNVVDVHIKRNDRLPRRQKEQRAAKAAQSLRRANYEYESGDFTTAVGLYGELLTLDPDHLDARNNISLALMNLGNDLAATLELEVLHHRHPDYLPALINLTVIYERMGKRDSAREMAETAYGARPDIPMTTFNYAWFQQLEGDVVVADELMQSLARINVPVPAENEMVRKSGKPKEKYWEYAELTNALATTAIVSQMTTIERGLFRDWNLTEPWHWLVTVLGFLLVAVILAIICGKFGKGGFLGFYLFLLHGGAFYILVWGVPMDWWWSLAGGYVLIFGIVAAAQKS